jgi:tryptophan-rich sensory protein
MGMEARQESGSIGGAAGWFVLVVVVAAIGAAASVDAGDFYATLARPAWAPPASVFGPAWTVLYLMMAIAAVLAWRAQGPGKSVAMALFAMQLAFNGLWSWLFFGFHLGALALIDIALLWLVVLATIRAFWRLRPLAGALLVPYLLWISFAAALNFAVWRMNPGLLGA